MSTGVQKTFKGYAVTSKDKSKWADFDLISYQSKSFTEDDVEIAITHCGVCGSDVHTLTQGWSPFSYLPLVVGHEIAGTAVRVGKNAAAATGIKEGARVGVGAQIGSCLKNDCKYCQNDNENYCPGQVDTYNAEYPNGEKTMGGYSNGIIAHHQFVFPIPDEVASEDACSMLCGGLTVFSPLVRNGAGPGKTVGIIGIGGLGHYAILFAKALGATVYAFTHSNSKTDDIKKMGADKIIVTEPGFEKELAGELDLIVCTRDNAQEYPLKEYLSMLTVHGKFITVGIPDDTFPGLQAMSLAANGCFMGGSHIGSKKEALQMLDIAAKKRVKPWIEVMPMKEASKAVQMVNDNKVRYRYVLVQDIDK